MRPTRVHARIVLHPFAHLLLGARFDSFRVLRDDLILDLHGFLQTSSRIFERNGKLFEKATGSHIPMSLCFSKVTKLEYSSFFPELENYPPDDESRVIVGMYSWQQPRKENVFYVLFLQDPVAADMKFFAQRVNWQMSNDRIPSSCVRNWSPAPPMPERLSTEAALERVREHHPWARPDSHHWLALRWQEKNMKE